jgi:integral membrane protein
VNLLLAYRVLAYVTGVLLVVLTVGVPLKYLTTDASGPQQAGEWITHVVGFAHGWLYMIYVLVTLFLSLRQRWSILMTVLVALAGTIPFAVFFAEHRVMELANAKAAARLRRKSFGGAGEPVQRSSAGATAGVSSRRPVSS